MNEEIYVVGEMSAAEQTVIHPLGLVALVVLGACVLFAPKRWSVFPFLLMACFVSSAQRIVIAGLDFDYLRIMVLIGILRILLRKEYTAFVWMPLDTAMALFTISSMAFYIFRVGTFPAMINRLGFAFDAFGMYFLFRCLIRKWTDLDRTAIGIILISVPIAVFFILENYTGRNIFAVFGGVREITWIRAGRLRCQGAFSHPILAGCFWASILPLTTTLWWKSKQHRVLAIVGITTSLIIVACCASSTPVVSVCAAIIGCLSFSLRHQMRFMRWGVSLALIMLHMVMNAPVWHLIGRLNVLGSSAGYHRYILIDLTLKNFDDWWLNGCSGYTVASWGIWAGDITNQYVYEGVTGGVATLTLFILLVAVAFREIGKIWRLQTRNIYHLRLAWALGVSLFVHCVNYFGVAYFGQINIIWYLLLAMIGSMSVCTRTSFHCVRKQGSLGNPVIRPLRT